MIVGASAAVAAAALASVVLATRIEWDNAPDALKTLAIITLPPLVGGSVLTLFGRWIYGEWNERAPVMRVASLLAQAVGVVMVVAMGGLFVLLLFAGVGPGERQTAVALAGGMATGFLVIFIGWAMKPSRRSSAKYFD
jgi:hypothetical protein